MGRFAVALQTPCSGVFDDEGYKFIKIFIRLKFAKNFVQTCLKIP